MEIYEIETEHIQNAKDIVESVNLGKRGNGDGTNGTKEEQIVGVLAEQFAHYWFFGEYPENPTEKFDGGYDFVYRGHKIDVKSVGRKVPPKQEYECYVWESQLKYDCDIYVFCWVDKRERLLYIWGWTTKEVFLRNARRRKKGDIIKYQGGELKLKADDRCLNLQELIRLETIKFIPKK